MWCNALLDSTWMDAGWPRTVTEMFSGLPVFDLLDVDAFARQVPKAAPSKIGACLEILDREGATLVLAGHEPGTGKTAFAYLLWLRDIAQMARAWGAEKHEWNGACWGEMPRHTYVEWPRALGQEKSKFRTHLHGSYLRPLEKVDFLVIDDVYNSPTKWELSELELVVGQRYNMKARTILVLEAAADLAVEDILGPKTYSRIAERGGVVQCNWEPYR